MESTSTAADSCACIVCNLLKYGFSTNSFMEKVEIIQKGRAKPLLKNLTTKVKAHFNVDMYEQYEWLTGCDTQCKLFCWPCILFVSAKGVWNSKGFSDLNNVHNVTKRHTLAATHLQAVIKEKLFGKVRIAYEENKLKKTNREHNELVEKNRRILKRFIEVVCFLGEYENAFSGQDESSISTNTINFMDQITFLSKYDKTLKLHLERSTVFRERSSHIQNDLIFAIATVVLEKIKEEIKETSFVAIVLDETTDITNVSQISAIVRYVTNDGKIRERFLGFLDVPRDRTAESLCKLVCDIVVDLKCDDKLVVQSYDGGVVMAEQLGTLQAKVKVSFPNAHFVHCSSHRLDLILSQSVVHIKECKIFFSTLIGMVAFFSKSTKRTQVLDLIVQNKLPNAAPTCWNYNGKLVLTVYEHRQPLIELFENILENSCDWDAETLNMSRCYLDCLKRDFTFNFLLHLFSEIFPFTDNLFDIFQNKINDIGFCITKVEEFQNILNEKGNGFDRIWENVVNSDDDLQPESKRMRADDDKNVKTTHPRLFIAILEHISDQLNYRFNNFKNLKFLELCNFSAFLNKPFPENAFKCLLDNYGNLFDIVALRSQLTVIYGVEEVTPKNNAKELLSFLKESGLDKGYAEVLKLCELVLTNPASSDFVDCGFSTLKRIKSYVRNSKGQEQELFSKLSVLSIEKELIQEMLEHPRFYDDVTDEFSKIDGRIELHYK